ncbi:MAG: four-carbon acid sugar kinase family protein [Eubacteriales bacterium]|nr:four-carbon acid sugar kinase family protein [Eubacteriales bacterium]
MKAEIISTEKLFEFPLPDKEQLQKLLAEELRQNSTKFVVLDDDPTGVQTVHDVSVFTDWSVESMTEGFKEDSRLFYILTNSRGMTEEETTKIHKEILASVAEAARITGKSYQFISRGDSTLRGHYPLETQLLREGLEKQGEVIAGEILLPYFKEGGRFTLQNTHYVKYGDQLVPAGETEFARDRTFGYRASSIPEYVEEKTKGAYKAEEVTCISLKDLREQNFEKICQQLREVKDFGKVCVNCCDDCDLMVFCIALYRVMREPDHKGSFLYRTAAGFVKIAGGISDQPLLTREQMVTTQKDVGGIVVVGSHTAKTTAQLKELLNLHTVVPVEFHSGIVLQGKEAFEQEIARCVSLEEDLIRQGKTVVCFTERKLLELEGDTKESALLRSVAISDGVQRLVGDLKVHPAFVVAKGGITSSDVGTKALKVRKAKVLGQIQPGIPVWQTGEESRFPEIPYVIFPGNVGEEQTLRKAVEILQGI